MNPQQPKTAVLVQEEDGLTKITAEAVGQSLRLGLGVGVCGTLCGATVGIIRGVKTPVLFSLFTGFQWFGLSSVFHGTRKLVLARYGPESNVTPGQKVKASTIAGALCPIPVGLLVRGPRNVLPGAIVFSLLGATGQYAVNKWSALKTSPQKNSSWFKAKWSPVTKLSDEQYQDVLDEKLLGLEADIAIIDETIAALKVEKQTRAEARDTAEECPPAGAEKP